MMDMDRDHQATVLEALRALQARGVTCWMDIDGGMSRDIYDSMAEGVQGAAVVICFMSKKYQSSEKYAHKQSFLDQSSAGKLFLKKCDYSCKLELKFARQTGVPIVPVMMENRAAGWKPSDWLGVITAGALWTPLFSEADFETNITSLVSQVQASVGSTTVEMLSSDSSADREEEEEEEQEESSDFSVPEMRQELERLRADSEKSGAHQTTMDGEECTLPAMIPETHDGMVVSDSMHTLVDTVISATSKRRCGFWGTGGIGKTTTSAWLCRQRRKFTSNPPLVVIPRPFLTGCL